MRISSGADRILPKLTVGTKMENSNLNRSLCEEMFGGDMDVTEKVSELLENEKSQVRQYPAKCLSSINNIGSGKNV